MGRRHRSRRSSTIAPARALYERLMHPLAALGWRFALLGGFLALVFLLGGSARPDIASLPALRSLSALVVGIGCLGLRRGDWQAHRGLFGFALAITVLVLVQLIPLPPGVAAALPGRGVLGAIDHALGGDPPWRPLDLAPSLGWNALWSLPPPLAVLVLGVQLSEVERHRLLLVMIGAGLASALIGVGQIADSTRSPLYFYEDTHFGLPVGLLANRNHQALLLASLLPMLAVWARHGARLRKSDSAERRLRRALLALPGALLLVALILLTGSRSGMVVTVLACLAVPLVLRSPPHSTPGEGPSLLGWAGALVNRIAPAVALGAVALLVAVTVWSGRAESVNRLSSDDPVEDMRVQILPTLGQMAHDYWLTGSGAGSFRPVYRMHEADAVLAPAMFNTAHDNRAFVALNEAED